MNASLNIRKEVADSFYILGIVANIIVIIGGKVPTVTIAGLYYSMGITGR